MAKLHEDFSYTQDRELSWLRFNERVLEESRDPEVPLYERLKFVSIFTSNLDEFFMIRVGSLFDMALLKEEHIDNKTGLTPKEQLSNIFKAVPALCKQKDKSFAEIEERLRQHDISNLSIKELESSEKKYIEKYWKTYILPILSPQVVDSHHPFPHLENKALYIAVMLKDKGGETYGIIPVPTSLPKVIFLPGSSVRYVLTEQVVLEYAAQVFDMYDLTNKTIISITRNADISPEDDSFEVDDDFRLRMRKVLKKRARLAPVRMEIQGEADQKLIDYFCERLGLRKEQVFLSKSPLGMGYIFALQDKFPQTTLSRITYPPFEPQPSRSLNREESVTSQVLRHDILLFYPYEQMDPFLQLIRESASDPNVLSIKITIYRLASQAKLIEYLAQAAENNKDVTVLMELRARFDEENNINWSERLEEAGCQVIYGFEGFKVHSKICLITRRDKGDIQYITQVGTGNYNEKTAKLYTDLSLMTANQEIGNDAAIFFKNMAIANLEGSYRQLLVAPHAMKNVLLDCIDEEIVKAKAGQPAKIVLKMNSITERLLIDKLAEASQAGVEIHMIVRGICCIVPHVPEKTDNIDITSIVGRFLEHPRIYIFGAGDDPKIYIGSADMMTRNTDRRVEIACPVLSPQVKQRIFHILDVMLRDNVKARVLQSDGRYLKKQVAPGEALINSQEYFIAVAKEMAAKQPAPVPVKKKKRVLGRFFRMLAEKFE
ncbi:polyphosphate kinase 1 [Zongyangia hominis]|uniref:polyphosphate kinase 1 n=1 Tax=Zongyangia hominis TaxID=2763677 RepID=UPI0021CC4FB0|nr:polyphosphate kinase 1 [Zongyangia hominis]